MEGPSDIVKSFEAGPFPLLRTERLVLREIIKADAEAVFLFRGDPDVQRLNDDVMTKVEQAYELIDRMTTGYRDGSMVEWGVTVPEVDNTVIGIFGYANWSHIHRRAEIGYCLKKEFWRMGIGFEAMGAIVPYGFASMGLNRIHACPRTENVASIRLLEKLKFKCEGVFQDEFWEDGKFQDEAQYALLRRDFRDQSAVLASIL